MGMDIHGICQKKINGEWKTVPLRFRWFTEGYRNAELFYDLQEIETPAEKTESVIWNDLFGEIAKIDAKDALEERTEKEILELLRNQKYFCDSRHGFTTLYTLQHKRLKGKRTFKMIYPEFVGELEELFAGENSKECRIVFCFDV